MESLYELLILNIQRNFVKILDWMKNIAVENWPELGNYGVKVVTKERLIKFKAEN